MTSQDNVFYNLNSHSSVTHKNLVIDSDSVLCNAFAELVERQVVQQEQAFYLYAVKGIVAGVLTNSSISFIRMIFAHTFFLQLLLK